MRPIPAYIGLVGSMKNASHLAEICQWTVLADIKQSVKSISNWLRMVAHSDIINGDDSEIAKPTDAGEAQNQGVRC